MPKVSVVIPNFNYARYLPERVESVLRQTLADIEVIYLDDASSDNSAEVIARYRSDPRLRVFSNEINSGNTFLQWKRGLEHCRGQYVWIAEADDYAHPQFLAELVGRLDRHPEIGVSYCQSWIVDEESRVLRLNLEYTQGLDAERWKQDYLSNGNDECCRAMIFMNTIPNASAAVFRRATCERVGGPVLEFRLSGDWVFWLRMVRASGVAYVAEPLNFYRCHAQTVRSASLQGGLWLEEMARVIADLYPELSLPPGDVRRLQEHFWMLWSRACNPWQVPWRRHWRIYRSARRFSPEIGRRLMLGVLRRLPRLPAKIARHIMG